MHLAKRCGLAAVWLAAMSGAEAQLVRCGNLYTDTALVSQRCQPLAAGPITVVPAERSTHNAYNASAAEATQPGAVPNRPLNETAVFVLASAKARLADLHAEFNAGYPVKTALELRNPQVFQQRLDALRVQIDQQTALIEKLERAAARSIGDRE